MKTRLTILALLALTTAGAQAAVDYSDTFTFDIYTGELTNVSEQDVPFAGLSFADPDGLMDPALYTGFAAHVGGAGEGMMFIVNNFGVSGLSIAELGASAGDISEGTAGADAVWPAGLSMNFGLFAANCDYRNLTTVIVVNEDGTYVSGELLTIPEPATMSLLGLGALGLMRRRR